MSPNSFLFVRVSAIATALAAPIACAQITIPTVTIGNPGNAPDEFALFGDVAYAFKIGVTEVTNAQYAAFLNAVADTDTFGLYNTAMTGTFGGITRSGSSGSYTYAATPARANHPVNSVSFWDAARFANWLHNGQPDGPQNNTTTEDGAYTLSTAGISANTITRNAAWRWALPTQNEWHKAAYHQPASQGGDPFDYWAFPNSSNVISTAQANYAGAFGNTRPVGSYAANFYGTFDMGGNVQEWTDIIRFSSRGTPGGAFDLAENWLLSTQLVLNTPSTENVRLGFRVTQAITLPPPCAPDFNASGSVTVQDIFDFLAAYFANDPRADFNASSGITVQDIFDFLAAYFTGC